MTFVLENEYAPAVQTSPEPVPTTVAAALARIRSWRQINAIPASRFAVEAGLSETVTRDMDSPDWNPTRATLQKLEALVPAGWQPGDPVPKRRKARVA